MMSGSTFLKRFIRVALPAIVFPWIFALAQASAQAPSTAASLPQTSTKKTPGVPPEVLEALERRARVVLMPADPDAIVVASDVTPQPGAARDTAETPMPGGPFALRSTLVGEAAPGGAGEVPASVELKVWTTLHPLPSDFTAILSSLSGPGIRVLPRSLPIPASVAAAVAARAAPPSSGDLQSLRDAVRTVSEGVVGLPRSLVEEAAAAVADGAGIRERFAFWLRAAAAAAAAGILLLVATRAYSIVSSRRSTGGVVAAIRDGLARMTQGSQGNAGGASTVGRQRGDAERDSGENASSGLKGERPDGSGLDGEIAELGVRGVTELLSDLYWGGRDAEAAWVLARTPVSIRREILANAHHLSDWARSIASFATSPSSAPRDPAYLSPLNLSHVDNVRLGELLAEHGVPLWMRLSAARRAGARISSGLRLDLARSVAARASGSPETGETEGHEASRSLEAAVAAERASRPRHVDVMDEIVPASDAEEDSLIEASRGDDWRVARAILSLGHAARLPDAVLRAALEPFGAREIARGLSGSDLARASVLGALPKEKRETCEAYSADAAGRGSGAHRALFSAIREAVDAMATGDGTPTAKPEAPEDDASGRPRGSDQAASRGRGEDA